MGGGVRSVATPLSGEVPAVILFNSARIVALAFQRDGIQRAGRRRQLRLWGVGLQ